MYIWGIFAKPWECSNLKHTGRAAEGIRRAVRGAGRHTELDSAAMSTCTSCRAAVVLASAIICVSLNVLKKKLSTAKPFDGSLAVLLSTTFGCPSTRPAY